MTREADSEGGKELPRSSPYRMDRRRSQRMAPRPSTPRSVRAIKTARARAHQSASPQVDKYPPTVPGMRGSHEDFAPTTHPPPLRRSRQYVPLFRPELSCEEEHSDAASAVAILLLEASLHDTFELFQPPGVVRRWRHTQLVIIKRDTTPGSIGHSWIGNIFAKLKFSLSRSRAVLVT